jgi:dUTP pyrophosphatase
MNINFYKLNKNAKVPYCGTDHSAGYDLRACISENYNLKAGDFGVIGTGLAIEIPGGFFGMVCPRSGLAAKNGITVLNSPGIVDSDYRGEVKCILINLSQEDFIIENEMRIAQLIICKHEEISWIEYGNLSISKRGEKGLGSTGVK